MTNADFNETEEILFNFPIFYLPKHLFGQYTYKSYFSWGFSNSKECRQ